MLLILRSPFGVVLLGLLAGSVAIPISPAAPCLSNPGAAPAVNSNQKRALLIGVGVHPRDTGYARLPGVAADMRLMQNVLAKQGFEDIRVIRDQEADLAGLQVAFETLIEQSGVDDVVVVHYSGHGDRLPDDDPDNPDDLELDGFDEVLVPYGAPSARRVREMPDGVYQGEKHLRDDALHAYLDRLRRKVGPGGHVLVVLDACNSGSGTRGEVVFRGGDGPIGSNLGDGVEEPQEMDALDEDEALAPYVALFATRYDQKAVEVNAGLLTLALVAALESVPPGTSYQALFEKITARMNTSSVIVSTHIEAPNAS